MPRPSIPAILRVFLLHIRPRWRLFIVLVFCVFAIESLNLLGPLLYKEFFNGISTGAASPALIRILSIILIVHGVVWIFRRIGGVLNNYFQPTIMADLERTSFSYLLDHSAHFFSINFAGSLVRKIRRISKSFETLVDNILWNLFPLVITMTGILIVFWLQNPFFAYATLIWLFLYIIGNLLISRWKLRYDIVRAARDSEVTGVLSDSISNVSSIALFGNGAQERHLFWRASEAYRKIQMWTWNLAEFNEAAQGAFMILIEFVIMVKAVSLWQAGLLTVGDFVLLQGYLITLFERSWNLGRVIRHSYEALADAAEIVEILETPHEIRNSKIAKPLVIKKGKLSFENVTFRYQKTRTILDGFTLRVRPGEKIALVGPSGAGKSTIVKLLLRTNDVDRGRIVIDGQQIRRVTQESLRRAIAFVPQDTSLFHRSLRENIRYGRLTATDEEVEDAARRAHCHEFITELPQGYDTLVGERGIRLSGGERQRVAIARAILKDAPILVLDEATSSLDSESESLIQEALRELMRGRTTIVIAHRLSTILTMDRIVVLAKGKVVEQGTHNALLKKKNGLYQRLWRLQAGGFIR